MKGGLLEPGSVLYVSLEEVGRLLGGGPVVVEVRGDGSCLAGVRFMTQGTGCLEIK